jgi:GntR family transcriptional regulator
VRGLNEGLNRPQDQAGTSIPAAPSSPSSGSSSSVGSSLAGTGVLTGVEAAGWTGRQIVVDVTELPAPPQVADFLQLDAPGTPSVRRRRLRLVSRPEDGIPERVAMIADTWTPPDIAYKLIDGRAPLMSPQDTTLPGGIYYALGFRQVRFIDNIEVRMPTAEEAELMSLSPGTAVGQHARIGIDETGRRVRVLIHIWAGDRQVITYDLPVPERRLPTNGDSE